MTQVIASQSSLRLSRYCNQNAFGVAVPSLIPRPSHVLLDEWEQNQDGLVDQVI